MPIDFNFFFNQVFKEEFKSSYSQIHIKKQIKLPALFLCDEIVIKKTKKKVIYSKMYDYLLISANRETIRNLALSMLFLMFAKRNECLKIKLTNPESDIKIIDISNPQTHSIFFRVMNSEVRMALNEYKFEKRVLRSSGWGKVQKAEDYPAFILTKKNYIITEKDEQIRDVLRITSQIHSLCLFADCLLNLAANKKLHEYEVDSHTGLSCMSLYDSLIKIMINGD